MTSPPRRLGKSGNESWVAIVGAGVEPFPLDVPFEQLAVVARITSAGPPLVVYGSVLPWLAIRSHASELVRDGEEFIDVFERVLAAQKADHRAAVIQERRPVAPPPGVVVCERALEAGCANEPIEDTHRRREDDGSTAPAAHPAIPTKDANLQLPSERGAFPRLGRGHYLRG